jgi:hypothetical protein
MGVPDMVIQRILRHSNVNTTQTYYIKKNDADAKTAMVTFEQNLDKHLSLEVVQDTQRTLDQGAKLGTGTIN